MYSSTLVRAIDGQTKRKMMAGSIAASILAVSLVVTLGMYGGIFIGPSSQNVHPNDLTYSITNVVSNDFADFEPYAEAFEPNAPNYVINLDLSNIINIGAFPSLTSSERSMIAENGFVTRPQSEFKQIHEILKENEDQDIPSFVSSDAVLHAFHIVYDLALRQAEVYSFWDILGNLTISMASDSYDQYHDAPEGRWKDAALRNVAFFYVASYLLDNSTVIPTEVQADVDEVLALIEAHEGGRESGWFMGYDEDFSQYVPRGHYTRSALLEKYFIAMMWYGRIAFRLQPDLPGIPNERGMNETAQAILMSLALSNDIETLGSDITGFDAWDAIYQPTVFFVGAADDLLPTEYLGLVGEIWGTEVTLADLNDDDLLEEFIDLALELREPLILSSFLWDYESMNQTKGMRFMGQRFIPDSFILSQLVYTNVGTPGSMRLMPKGLDVMAALGSDRAWELLDDQKHFANYITQMEGLWDMVGNITESEWTKNLYYLWLYSLLPLLSDPGEGYPLFMQSEAWVDKQLNTALGSWTELRHDTILYAKQSYTQDYLCIPHIEGGYVEPIPSLYGRLASLCKMMISGLDDRGLLSEWLPDKLNSLQSLLVSLRAISLKELSGITLNSTDISLIDNSGDTLADIVAMPTDNNLVSDADDYMALIADVHTDPNTESVLEEAVGHPMIIYAAVLIDGQVVLARGGTFSYYEFTQPWDDRLTDEAWQAMLESGDAPPLPDWTSSFVAAEGGNGFLFLVATSKDE